MILTGDVTIPALQKTIWEFANSQRQAGQQIQGEVKK
jgi:hypothetical protein